MKIPRAVAASLLGTVVVIVIVWLGGLVSGRDADLCALLGAAVTEVRGTWSWLLGAVLQLLIGVVAAIVYAAIFEWVTRRAGVAVGCAVALGHTVIAGLAVGFLPAARLIEAAITPPGAFIAYRGPLAVAAFVIAHLAFGTIIGVLYGRPRHALVAQRVVWHEVKV